MSSTEWRPDGEESKSNEERKFGDALAALAVKDTPDIDPVEAVRDARENV